MVTRQPYLFIDEHIEDRETSYEEVGETLGVSRTTVWRWAKEQHRLDPQKMEQLARALGLGSAQDLHRPPSRPSIDGILSDADPQTYQAVLDLAKSLTNRS